MDADDADALAPGLSDKCGNDVFPLSDHIEQALFHLFSRKHKVGDVVYRVPASNVPEYWRIIRHDKRHDVFTLQKLATIRLYCTATGTLYDWSHDVRVHEYKEIPSFVLDAKTRTLIDANQPVMICFC
jgi:hypothetical protein